MTLVGQAQQQDQSPSWTDLFQLAKDGKVLVGKDGWLFLHHDGNAFMRQFAGELKLSPGELDQWRRLLETRRDRIRQMGASYHVLVCPEGASVYPEKLPDEIVAAAERPVLQIVSHLEDAHSPVRVIYPVPEMQAEKSRWEVYRRTDSHWSEAGAYVAYRELVKEIAQSAPVHQVSEEELHFCELNGRGDLAYKLDVDPGTSWCARYLYSKASLVHDNRVYLNGSLIITECPEAPPTTCLVFGDSACFAMLTFLSHSFRRMVFALMPVIDYDLISAENPDVVVSEMVERYLIAVPDDSLAPSLEVLEEGVRLRGPERPRITSWDPFPDPLPEDVPPSIEAVETVRAKLLSRGRREDALFVSLMAYAGLTPGEAVALRWPQLRDDVLIPESLDIDTHGSDDPARVQMRLMKPLAEELAEWRAFCGSPEIGPVLPGLIMQNWERWVRRVYPRAVKGDVALEKSPVVLCSTFVVLLIRSGATPSEVARQTGRSRAEIADGFYFIWDKRARNAEPEDVSGEVSRVRASIMSRARPPSLPVRLLSNARHVRAVRRARPLLSGGRDPFLSAETVERIRARLLANGLDEEATFVSVIAYAGLRPGEARTLKWRQIEDSKLAVGAVPIGFAPDEDRKLQERTITLLEPLAEDLANWRVQSGNPERGYVFPNLRQRDWQKWVKRDYRRAARPAGRGSNRPAALCHTFCALLIAEGASVEEVARQAGLPRRGTITQYAHLLEVARMQPPVSAAQQIRDARAAVFKTTS